MSKKFTGITSAGSAIPVYDKDAHSALNQKLDTAVYSAASGNFLTAVPDEYAKTSAVEDMVSAASADLNTAIGNKLDTSSFADVSGSFLTEVPESAVSGFATHEEVESATSGKADTSAIPSLDGYATEDYVYAATSGKANTEDIINYDGKPSANPIYAYGNEFYDVDSIAGSGVSINRSNLYLSGTVTASTGGFTANGISANNNDGYFCIKCQPEVIYGGGGAGFTFSSMNTDFGTAQLTTAGYNQIAKTYSPKFEARNVSGAGFSIEASGARGYDASGNVVWDTYNPPAPTQLIAGADSPKPSILLSPYMPKTMSAQFSNAPLFSADGNGIYIGISGQYLKALMNGLTARNSYIQAELADRSGYVTGNSTMNGGEVSVYHSSAFGSANSGTWTLTQSVQKREIECDSATSAITAIAGSAIGGGSTYSAGDNIDITDDVISGKDWSEDIASATSGLMQTSGLEYDGDKISGYMGSAFKAGDELPSGVMVESAVGYNAVNEISGYNGSAIAQYGAEKQWLVHDDTLVHAANSAQYALGVNLSAVAQLLGVDETVLWETDQWATNYPTALTLSEDPQNFKEIRVLYGCYGSPDGGNNILKSISFMPNANRNGVIVLDGVMRGAPGLYYNVIDEWSGINTTAWAWVNGKLSDFASTSQQPNNNKWCSPYKIVGVGRKQ